MCHHIQRRKRVLFTRRSEHYIVKQDVHVPSGTSINILYSYNVLLLTHLPMCRVYASVNWVNNGSDNGLSPGRRQAIIWTNAGILLIGLLRTNFGEILIQRNAFENDVCEMSVILFRERWVNYDMKWVTKDTATLFITSSLTSCIENH